MKQFTVHTSWDCPSGCTHMWNVNELLETFTLKRKDVETLEVNDTLAISEDLILQRDK